MKVGSKKTHPYQSFRNFCVPQEPQPGLLQLALFVQENGQVVNRVERVGVLGSQLGLAAFQCSVLETFCLAARDGALSLLIFSCIFVFFLGRQREIQQKGRGANENNKRLSRLSSLSFAAT